jgi:hypothetical protein
VLQDKDKAESHVTHIGKNKKIKKKDKKFSAKVSVTDDQPTTNGKFLEYKSDLYIYDIPKKF